MCGSPAALAQHSESERAEVAAARRAVVHHPGMDPLDVITNDDIAAAKRLWLAARDQGAPRLDVEAAYRWYTSLVSGQAHQIREHFWQRLGLPTEVRAEGVEPPTLGSGNRGCIR